MVFPRRRQLVGFLPLGEGSRHTAVVQKLKPGPEKQPQLGRANAHPRSWVRSTRGETKHTRRNEHKRLLGRLPDISR